MFLGKIRMCNLFRVGVFLFLCLFLVQPLAETASAEGNGWVEIRAELPEDLQGPVVVSIMGADGSEKTIFVLKENDYIGRAQLPYGTYYVMHAGIEGDVKMRYPSTWTPTEFKLAEENGAAELITVTVTNPESYSPIVEASATGEATGQQEADESGPTMQIETEAPAETEPAQTESSSLAETTDLEEKNPAPEETSEPGMGGKLLTILRGVGATILVMAVFVGIVCGIIYFVRRREF